MKLEDLKVGSIIMHADAKTNPIHTGTIYIVLKIDKEHEDIEACCVNSQIDIAIVEVRHISTRSISEYNTLTQIVLAPPADNLSVAKKDLYIRWGIGKKPSLGKVGVKTPYKLENGRNLFVGDVVSIKNDYIEKKDCLVVYDEDDGYYVMGIASGCNSKTGEIKDFTVSLEKSFSDIKKWRHFCDCLVPKRHRSRRLPAYRIGGQLTILTRRRLEASRMPLPCSGL